MLRPTWRAPIAREFCAEVPGSSTTSGNERFGPSMLRVTAEQVPPEPALLRATLAVNCDQPRSGGVGRRDADVFELMHHIVDRIRWIPLHLEHADDMIGQIALGVE